MCWIDTTCKLARLALNVEDILFDGKPVEKEHSNDMLEILKNIDKQGSGQGYGFVDYTFNRGITGWKADRHMKLGMELHKLLLKMQREGLHIDIDIPVVYTGPNLEIDESRV